MRSLVLSDIHANLAALEAVLRDAEGRHLDQIWCLGDVVGYGPDPNQCVECVRALEPIAVAGNHDLATLGKMSISEFNPDAQRACLWTSRELNPEGESYLQSLPAIMEMGDFTLVHGSPREPIWEYILSPSIAQANFACFDTPFCVAGHTHAPLVFVSRPANGGETSRCEAIIPQSGTLIPLGEERLIANPGSVGQPRDGDPRASYLIVDTDEGTLEYRRVHYPIEETQRRMEAKGLPYRLITRLSFGW